MVESSVILIFQLLSPLNLAFNPSGHHSTYGGHSGFHGILAKKFPSPSHSGSRKFGLGKAVGYWQVGGLAGYRSYNRMIPND
jgi:hypothetical protein